MTIALTCSCSARLEVDERFAGQSITCPDCQRSLPVPASAGPVQRTSWLAIASVILALVGAFTVFGTLLAAVLGVVALLGIRAQPQRLAGTRLAVAGIALGLVLTALSVFAFTAAELFGVDSVLRESQWVGKLDYPDDLEVKRTNGGYKIKRPSAQWGVFNTHADGGGSQRSYGRDLLLIHPSRSEYILCLTEDVPKGTPFDQCQEKGIQVFRQLEITKFSMRRNPSLQVDLERGNKKLWNIEERGRVTRFMEMTVSKTYHGQTKSYLLRVIKKDDEEQFGQSKLYIIAAGAPAARFSSMTKEEKKVLSEALDSFQILE